MGECMSHHSCSLSPCCSTVISTGSRSIIMSMPSNEPINVTNSVIISFERCRPWNQKSATMRPSRTRIARNPPIIRTTLSFSTVYSQSVARCPRITSPVQPAVQPICEVCTEPLRAHYVTAHFTDARAHVAVHGRPCVERDEACGFI